MRKRLRVQHALLCRLKFQVPHWTKVIMFPLEKTLGSTLRLPGGVKSEKEGASSRQ